MRLLALAVWTACGLLAADLCPPPAQRNAGQAWQSYSVKNTKKWCVASSVAANSDVEWPAAGIEKAGVAGQVEVAVCCFRHESAAPEKLRIGEKELTVPTHREDPKAAGKEEDDDFPDLIEEDAHGRAVSIRGALRDGDRNVKVDVLLRCTASKFADQFAFQFTVINRSDKGVEVDWNHLREVRAHSTPNIQPVAGGMAYVFLTAKKPREAVAAVEVKSGGRTLGRFRFDGFTLTQ